MSKPALLKKGLLRAEPSGHPEGAQAPEGPPTIRRGCLANARQDNERGKRSEGCLANARQDNEGGNEVRGASLMLGITDGVKRDCDSKGRFSSTAENVFQQHRLGETG